MVLDIVTFGDAAGCADLWLAFVEGDDASDVVCDGRSCKWQLTLMTM